MSAKQLASQEIDLIIFWFFSKITPGDALALLFFNIISLTIVY